MDIARVIFTGAGTAFLDLNGIHSLFTWFGHDTFHQNHPVIVVDTAARFAWYPGFWIKRQWRKCVLSTPSLYSELKGHQLDTSLSSHFLFRV